MRNRAEKTIDEQMEDLRERMRMLQSDRKANIDILEANKTANREEIRRLREENKEIRRRLANIKRDNDRNEGGAGSGEIAGLQREVNKLRTSHDQLRSSSTNYMSTLNELRDELRAVELESRRPNQEDSPVMRNIRVLENRLDKAMIKYNEAMSIKKTYDQIVKRLQEERVGFDNQISSIERTLAAKNRDYQELLLLSGDANHAREVAQCELERVRKGYEAERKRREQELREKHQVVQMRKQMKERQEKREAMRNSMVSETAGDMSEEAEAVLKASLELNQLAQAQAGAEKAEHQSKIDIFENAFRKIKEATGVSDVNEVIQKIVSQEGTAESLMVLTKENQQKIEKYNETKNDLRRKIEEIKYSGANSGHRRKMVDDREEQVSASATRLERSRLKYERLAKSLISAKAGVEHLQDKLASVRDELNLDAPIDLTDDMVVEVLRQSETALEKMLQRVKAAEEEEVLMSKVSSSRNTDGAADDFAQVTDLEVMHARPFNQRIELPTLEEDFEDDGAMHDEGIPEMEDDELTRDKIKKASMHIMAAQEKKQRRRPRKKRAN